jgi:hypothetical protein
MRLELRQGLLILLLSAGGLVGTAYAQDDQEQPPDDSTANQQSEDQQPPDDSTADQQSEDQQPPDDSTADQQSDDLQSPDDSEVADDSGNDETVFMTEDWAADVVQDESDDAVQTDRERDPAGEGWVVAEQDAAAISSLPDWARPKPRARGDYAGKSEIPLLGPARPRAASPQQQQQQQGKDTPYSFGGKPVAPGSTPWKAQIYASTYSKPGVPTWLAQHDCGGSLIAAEWVLTAAHCIDDIVKAPGLGWRVRLGAHDLQKGDGVTYLIDRWVRHSWYKRQATPGLPPNMYAYDIGLVHIKADAETRAPGDSRPFQPIQLYRGPVYKDAEVTAIGWGMTQRAAQSFSTVPVKVDLQVMDNDICQQRKGYGPGRINATVMCAAKEKQKTCTGDSGGPVILTNNLPAQLVGLVSWGKDRCTGDGEPSIFTRVQSHLAWIDKAMKLEPTRSSLP